jgi:tetratricopeptide (TPR) repeat protein
VGNLGNALFEQGDTRGALGLLEGALSEMEALGDRRGLAMTFSSLGRVYAGLGESGRARERLERALEIQETLREATGALMRKFYELWNPGDGKADLSAARALLEAQAFVPSHAQWKHPYFWAAWVLWGLP